MTSKTRAYLFLCLFVLSMLVVASFFSIPTQASPAAIQTISTNALTPCGIAIDSNNYPHIAYMEWVANWSDYPSYGTGYLIYATWNGATWVKQIVAEDAGFYDLALDSHNNAHILFKAGSDALMYASWTGSSWNIQTVDQRVSSGSLALDPAGNPHIAYLTIGDETHDFILKYAAWNGSTWNRHVVDDTIGVGSPSIKVDLQSNPHIMYEIYTIFTPTNSSELLKYAILNRTSGWDIQTVGTNIGFLNMVLDSNGYAHFSHLTGGKSSGNITETSWNGTAWIDNNLNVIDDGGGYYIALDKQDNAYIEFNINGGLMCARWTGDAWAFATMDTNPLFNIGPLAVDSNGHPHVCYFRYGATDGEAPYDLMYATTNTPIQTAQPATPVPTETTEVTAQPFSAPLFIGIFIAIPIIMVLGIIALANWLKSRRSGS